MKSTPPRRAESESVRIFILRLMVLALRLTSLLPMNVLPSFFSCPLNDKSAYMDLWIRLSDPDKIWHGCRVSWVI